MKERMLFIGIGQGGSNIARLFEEEKYLTFYLNTSHDDLTLIDSEFKYHIPGGKGCNKDRVKALGYAENYYGEIVNTIESNFPSQDIVYLIFTLGGGTGSGLGPILLDILSMKNEDKKYNAIVVLPSVNESLKTRVNALEGYKELDKVEGLNSLFIIDNKSNNDKLKLNKEFFELFQGAMNMTNPDERGIIDKAELELLFTTKGTTIISKAKDKIIDNKLGNPNPNFNFNFKNNIFADFDIGCKYIGLSTNGLNPENEIKELEKIYGKPLDNFVGFNDKETIVIVTGMKMPVKTVYDLVASVDIDKKKMEVTIETPLKFDIPTIEVDERKKEVSNKSKEKDLSTLFKKYTR